MFYLGIDVSKKTTCYLILEELSNKLKRLTLSNDKDSISQSRFMDLTFGNHIHPLALY